MKAISKLIIFVFALLAMATCTYAADESPIFKAKDKAELESLLTNGADINAKNNKGKTLLTMLATSENKDFVAWLLTKGADINAKDNNGNTPLHIAAEQYDGKVIVELLLAKGADVNARDNNGNTPLHIAAEQYDGKVIVEQLLAKGADVSAKNIHGMTPLYRAAARGNKDIAELLIFKGADVNAQTMYGTSLGIAAVEGKEEMAEWLLAKGADVNANDKHGITPLHMVVVKGNKEMAEWLLIKGADVNAKASDGETPLHKAAKNYSTDIVVLLIAHGADVFAKTNNGLIPVQFANGVTEILLRETTIKKAKNPRALLTELSEQLIKNPDGDQARGVVIKLARKLNPPPSISEAARESEIKGEAIVRMSNAEVDQLKLAIDYFREALKLSPWWSDVYFNLGTVHELAGNYEQAQRNFNLYLLAISDEKEARQLQDRIYAIRAKAELSQNDRKNKYGTYLGGNWQLKVLDDIDMTHHPKRWRLNITSSIDSDEQYQVRLENYRGCPRAVDIGSGGGIQVSVKFTMIDSSNCAGDRIEWRCMQGNLHYFNGVYMDNNVLWCSGTGIGSIQGEKHYSYYELVP